MRAGGKPGLKLRRRHKRRMACFKAKPRQWRCSQPSSTLLRDRSQASCKQIRSTIALPYCRLHRTCPGEQSLSLAVAQRALSSRSTTHQISYFCLGKCDVICHTVQMMHQVAPHAFHVTRGIPGDCSNVSKLVCQQTVPLSASDIHACHQG